MKVDQLQPLSKSQRKLGIIAGGGDLPKQVIQTCRESGRPFFVLAIEGQTDKDTVDNTEHSWVKAGAVGKIHKLLRSSGSQDLVMVGYYKRPAWKEVRPDLLGARWLAKFITKLGKDDALLRLVINEFESNGFSVIGIEEIMGDKIMAREGTYGRHKPNKEDWVSIDRAFEVLNVLGKIDVGQSIVVQEGCVVGIEGMEGTDGLMARCKGLHPAGAGAIMAKIAKPDQDRRVDMPVIGMRTLETAIQAGMKGIAVQAGGVIILDEDKVIAKADKAGLFLIGVKP